ncbi:glycosyltransferase family 39 protein [Dyadobacter arcticus]|uniref:Membrane protein n=1 Tax=Dyadobacter arcticus TaxID=1078754 RepID=A0ABX0ULY7_9BACT|nr:glycosyltransferase family 39 protein [Dyadobacter arcticus]NIJ52690.1 putative membrane protein [Dyadobacter arcticus]
MILLLRKNILIILILVFAFFLRVYQSGSHGIYLDEKYTMVISQGIVMEGANQKDVFFAPSKTTFTPAEFWKPKSLDDFIEANIRGDIGNSPSYYVVLWLWMKIFGLSDFSARFPSVLASTLLVGLLFIFVKRHFKSTNLALLSAFLAAIEPFFVAYSHMARNYSMSFFLTLLATHVFLIIYERTKAGKKSAAYFVAYGLILALSLLSHYLTLTVFLCHGLFVLFYIRPFKRWIVYLATTLAGISIVSLWFIYGGGSYTFKTLAHQAKLYKDVALNNPTNNGYGEILPATLANVSQKSLPLFTDLFIFSNGLGQFKTLGIRNMALALFLGTAAVLMLHLFRRKQKLPLWVALLYPVLLIAGLPFFSVTNLQLVALAALPSFIYLLIISLGSKDADLPAPLLVFTLILSFVPTLFLIVMAFRNGHTYGITQRYSGFSFPYTVILIAFMIRQLSRLPLAFRGALAAVLCIQLFFVAKLLNDVYQDRAPKYTYFSITRQPNPYYVTAQKIKQLYAVGDTVVYPSRKLYFHDEIEKTYWPYSIQDAQLTNLYLPRDAKYVQRLDTTETDKIILTKPRGVKITLFDLQGKTYRY